MQRSSSTGSIYDLGYRPYDGSRLGRTYAITSLYWYSLRGIWGLGRTTMAKAFPFGLAILAMIPALVQIAVAAVAPAEFTVVRPESHFTYVQIIIALFCAVAAPEIVGRDQRARTLTLYFSRALSRADYVTAKLAALFVALFIVTLLPQALLLLGKAIAENDVLSYLRDNAEQVPPILVSCAVISFVMASIALAIASQSSRRAISTIAVLGYLIISITLANILVQSVGADFRGYFIFLSPIETLSGATFWIFGAAPEAASTQEVADLPGYTYFLACIAYAALFLGYLYRRFQRMSA